MDISKSKFKGHLNIGILKGKLNKKQKKVNIRILKGFPKSNLGNLEKLEYGGTLVNLLWGTVGAHLGEPLGVTERRL